MFIFKVCVVLIGCTFAVQASCWRSCGRRISCGFDSGESMCTRDTKTCDTIIVRPQDIPKPSVTTTLTAVPGPCACKRAIVKPAILPRPICRPSTNCNCGCACCHCGCNYPRTCGAGYASSCSSSSSTQCKNIYDSCGSSTMICTSGSGSAVSAPADAVSIAIAQQNAEKSCILDEDRLAFGFRKIPVELPKQKVVRQNNVPEEKIFSLNGQIVELKPVACTCTKSLDEEAVEELLALQEEEESVGVSTDTDCCAIKKISLGELGYAPAKIQKNSFVDVSEETETVTTASPDCIDSGYKAGNVEYKTVTKPASITITSSGEDTADCESNEAGEEQAYVFEDDCSYTPCSCGCGQVYKTCSSCSSSSLSSKVKKASLVIQKLCR